MVSVLLINSPIFKEKIGKFEEDSLPPIGLGYIATNLEMNGIKVELIDAYASNLIPAEICKLIDVKKPQYICLNIFTSNYAVVKEVVEMSCVGVVFIIGGQVVKHVYEEMLCWETENNIDIVIGEGDFIVSDIIQDVLKENPIIKTQNRRVFNVDKDSIYYPVNISDIPLNRLYFENEPQENYYGQLEANIITSRGCIHNCAFCGAARSLNKHITVREREAKSIIGEIKYLKNIYPKISSIRVLDDLFLKNIESINKAVDIFGNFNINWRCMAHVKSFKDVPLNIIKNMKTTGCQELFMGIESGSVRILQMINKTSDVEIIRSTIRRIFEAGINVKAYFILGFPGENEDDFVASYNLARQIKKDALECGVGFRVSAFQFRPYHGTKLYEIILHKNGTIGTFIPNLDLSKQVGRTQFNLHSGNYSNCDDSVLNKYIGLMINLDI